ATNFLVMAEGKKDRPRGAEAALYEEFGCLDHRNERALIVDGAAAPDIAIRNRAGEGRMLPLVFRAGRDGHHVDMRHEQNRIKRSVRPLPCIKERVLANDFARS